MDNKKREWDVWFGGTGIVIGIASFVLSMVNNDYSLIGLYGFAIGVILVVIGMIIDKLRKSNETDIVEKNKIDMLEWFDDKIKEYKVNTDDTIFYGYRHYYWVKDGKFFLFPQKEDFIRRHVSLSNSINYCEKNAILEYIGISDIVYFKTVGDVSYVTNVESTGINVKGAAIGAVVAGDAGAIIGSRPKITSKVEEKDNRFVELKYKDNDTIKTLEFDYTALNIFRNLFPEKEFEYVNFKSENLEEKNVTNDTTTTLSLEEKFEKLKSLKNSGLITEEEFSDKKKELLKQI